MSSVPAQGPSAPGPAPRLQRLGPDHAAAILTSQDAALVQEIFGRRWDEDRLSAFLARTARWTGDGPIREFAAVDVDGTVMGGGGVRRIGPGIAQGEAEVSYWVLPRHRAHGVGTAIAQAVVDLARADDRVHRIVLRIAPDNAASTAIAARLGAVPEQMVEHPADRTRRARRWVVPVGHL